MIADSRSLSSFLPAVGATPFISISVLIITPSIRPRRCPLKPNSAYARTASRTSRESGTRLRLKRPRAFPDPVNQASRAFRSPDREGFEKLLCFGASLSLERLSHDRSRSGRDRAACSFEADVFHNVAVHLDVDLDLVAAQRVVAFGAAIGFGQHAEISRATTVVENQLLIEILEIGIQPKTSLTLWIPATNASISSFVL